MPSQFGSENRDFEAFSGGFSRSDESLDAFQYSGGPNASYIKVVYEVTRSFKEQ